MAHINPNLIISTVLQPHTPTLFPYTTLFRSPSPGRAGRPAVRDRRRDRRLVRGVDRRRGSGRARRGRRARPAGDQLDRKSTRLNSSHPSSSYAVFCLEKKNILVRSLGCLTLV